MPVLVKEIIAPDTYHTPDGPVRATPRRIRHWLRQGQRMLAKGLPIPVPWEHQDDAKPDGAMHLAENATRNAGFVEGFFLDRDGRLWGKLDIPDADKARHIQKNVRFVSPELDDAWTDGDGREWKDIITHVALTPRPVHYKQTPFGTKPRLSHPRRGSVWLSLDQGSHYRAGRVAGRLSRPGRTNMATSTTTPRPTRTQRRLSAKKRKDQRLSASTDTTTAEERKRQRDAGDAGPDAAARLSADAGADDAADAGADDAADGDGANGDAQQELIDGIRQLLADKMHLDLPPDTDAETILRDLYAALHGHPGIDLVDDDDDGDAADTDDDDQLSEDSEDGDDDHDASGTSIDGPPNDAREEMPRATLSHTRKVLRQTPEFQAMTEEVIEARTDKLLGKLAGYEREGRCSPAKARELRQLVNRHRLSFANKGDHNVLLLQARLEEIADVPAGTYGDKKQRLSHAQEQKPRTEWGNAEGDKRKVSPERAQEIVEEMRQNGVLAKSGR